MDAATITGIITGPVAALALAVVATVKLWGRMQKLDDKFEALILSNTQAMQAMQATAAATTHALEVLSQEVRILNGRNESGPISIHRNPP